MTTENLIQHMVREGVVSSQNTTDGTVRVIFQDTRVLSGWLKVLQHKTTAVIVEPDGEHTHTISSGGTASTEANHDHAGTVTGAWMPSVNDRVLVLYIPIFNGDGFVLGGL